MMAELIKKHTNQIFTVKMLEYCKKKFNKLMKKDTLLQKKTENYLKELQTNPYIGEKLTVNLPGLRSIHFLKNKYRIIYKVVDEPEPIIDILEIGNRKASYADLAKFLEQGK